MSEQITKKDKIRRFLHKSRWFNFLIFTLTIISVVLVSIEVVKAERYPLFERIEIAILIFFTAEFILEIFAAQRLRDYLLEGEGLVDFLSIASGISFIKALESIRLLRALRAIRIFKLFDGISGYLLNSIILVQVIVAISFSSIILNSCKLKTGSMFVNLEQLLYFFVMVMIFSTLFIVRYISKERQTKSKGV